MDYIELFAQDTYAIIQSQTKPGFAKLVYKGGKVVYVQQPPKELISGAAEAHNYTIEGTRLLARKHHKYCQKGPVMIRPGLCVAPLSSEENPDCIWIAFTRVAAYKKISKQETLLTFKDGSTLLVPYSIHIVSKQRERCYVIEYEYSKHG